MEEATLNNEAPMFIDELLAEAELKEQGEATAYFDMAIREISYLEEEIIRINNIADKDKELIEQWALSQNARRTERIELLKRKLESYIRSSNKKTIDLPNGILKLRQKPDKVEIENLELFLNKASKDMVSIVPEQIKPSLPGIKRWIKMTDKVPDGVKLIKGNIEFSLKLKKEDNKS